MSPETTSSSDRRSGNESQEALKRIGKYEIIRRLGAGGMGTVYLASDTVLKRTVALKVLSRDRASNPTLVRRFKSEGQAAALLQHKNIVSVYEAGEADGYLFLALEYIDGVDLLEWVNRRGPIPVKRSVEIIRQAAEALQHAFERNIVHRDIKPSNLMIARDGTVKLTDMGLARSIDETLDTNITRDGTTVGTVDYMAPEQASNSKAADTRSDIYSLGCTWYHLLTGQPPYPEGSVTNKISAHISGQIPNPRRLNPNVPEAVVAVMHRMLGKKKEQRYQTPAELLEDLDSPSLRRTQNTPNLLEMFGEELELESNEVLILDEDDEESVATAKVVTGKQGRRSAAKQKPARNFSSQPTRAELPVSPKSDSRPKLVRMAIDGVPGKEPAKTVPWGLILLSVLVLGVAIGGWSLISRYQPQPAPVHDFSPYAIGPAPEEAAPPEGDDSESGTAKPGAADSAPTE